MSLEEMEMELNEIRRRILQDKEVSPEEMAAVISNLREARKSAAVRGKAAKKKEKAPSTLPENVLELFD